MIYNSIIETIGNTPLVKLNKINAGIKGTILVKPEYLNPGNSIKDRIAVKMIEDAEKAGKLLPGGTIVEATSGNTGMGVALVAAVRGYKCIFTISDKNSLEKITALRSMGAKVVVCPSNVEADDPRSYYSVADKLSRETPNSFFPNQYDNASNSAAHYETTGPEIWQQTAGKITHYVAAVGTGGTMSGTAKYLKEKNSNLYSIGIDSYGSLLKKYKETGEIDNNETYPYMAEGFGFSDNMLPKNVDFETIDHFIKVTDKNGALTARKLAREEGLFAGWSSGSIVHGALEYARKHLQPDHTMVIILPDHGTRYLKKIYNDDWMKEQGFLDNIEVTAKNIVEQRKGESPLYTASKQTTMQEVASLMTTKEINQIPIVEQNEFIGKVTISKLLDTLVNDPSAGSNIIETVMEDPMPFVSKTATIGVLQALFNKGSSALLVRDMEDHIHIITRQDVLRIATNQRK